MGLDRLDSRADFPSKVWLSASDPITEYFPDR